MGQQNRATAEKDHAAEEWRTQKIDVAAGKRMQCADCNTTWTNLTDLERACPECGAASAIQVKLDQPKAPGGLFDPRYGRDIRSGNRPV
jgi:protein-arginine kinase activator protein McsA